MVLQAFIDDSYTKDGEFVLAGYIASAESWAKFSKDWEELLPFATLSKAGNRRFKMSDMAQGRMERVPAFYRVIETYALAAVSCRINIAELNRAKSRVWIHNTAVEHWGMFQNPFFTAFRCLLGMFHHHWNVTSQVIPEGQTVDFIFDNQTEKTAILSSWDEFMARQSAELRPRFGATPRFENDEEFLPLQAADFWAWWIRKWYEDGPDVVEEKVNSGDFGVWKRNRSSFPTLAISFDENQLVEEMIKVAREHLPQGRIIYDVQFSWKG